VNGREAAREVSRTRPLLLANGRRGQFYDLVGSLHRADQRCLENVVERPATGGFAAEIARQQAHDRHGPLNARADRARTAHLQQGQLAVTRRPTARGILRHQPAGHAGRIEQVVHLGLGGRIDHYRGPAARRRHC
jgi:hypothetical protein